MPEQPHRKRVKHYHEPGDFHELTFSCYQRLPLLTNDTWRGHLAGSLDDALCEHAFRLVAFVFMPEHVHLLIWPTLRDAGPECVSRFLADVKVGSSQKVKAELESTGSRLLSQLTVRERPGRTVFRFWQEGPGYDRNLQTEASVTAGIDYLHLNPVRRRLCRLATDWKWSSARWYVSDGTACDPDLPTIHGLPPGLFGSCN